MRYVTTVILAILFLLFVTAFAEMVPGGASAATTTAASTQNPAKNDEAPQRCQPSDLTVEGKEAKDFLFTMGQTLRIRATGECAAKLKKESATRPTLWLNGVEMKNLSTSYVQDPECKGVFISFLLARDSNDDDNRTAWDKFLKKEKGYSMTLKPALALGGDLPREVSSSQDIKFRVAKDRTIALTLAGGLVILLLVFFLLVRYTKMLCDEATGYYSLGKSQMAFWGLLVLLAFTAVWLITGTMERIPGQVLILLGISGATGLGAVLIKNSVQNEIAKLKAEKETLEKKKGAQQPLTPEEENRLKAIDTEIAAKSGQVKPEGSKGFWGDICDDGNGTSFHRLQMVIWTLVLGAVFVRSVANVMSMPEFSETLLTLMGISSGTYLGFKIREN